MSGDEIKTGGYRPDIDGLRAVAVLSVVIFHLGISAMEGGFLGVDIFFVISGYLITSILERRMVAGTFSFSDFYLRRIRRLIPPVIATVLATILASCFVLMPGDMIGFAYSCIAALLSVSNILFWLEAGYWDTASELKPLLHTWSLGVEEQFYLFWPAMLSAVLALFGHRRAGWFFLIVTIAGIALSEYMVRVAPSAAFYLIPSRVFEFSIGALALYCSRLAIWQRMVALPFARYLTDISLVILVALFFIYDGTTVFPGINGIIPCLLTAFILGMGSTSLGPVSSVLLTNRVSLWFGQVSYSMYLVHWPVVALLRYRFGAELEPVLQVIAAVLTLLLTAALHYGVERRFSSRAGMGSSEKRRLSPSSFALATVAASYLLTLGAGSIAINNGWSWRLPKVTVEPGAVNTAMARRETNADFGCRIEDYFDGGRCKRDRPIKVLFFGNSHEVDGYNLFYPEYGKDKDVLMISFGGWHSCNPRYEDHKFRGKPHCEARLEALKDDRLLADLDVLVYAAKAPFHSNKQLVLDYFSDLKAAYPDLKIITIGGFVSTNMPCAGIMNQTGSPQSCLSPEYVEDFDNEPEKAGLYDEIMAQTDFFVDRIPILCPTGELESCAYQTPAGVPMFYDSHHLTLEFATWSGEKYFERNGDIIRQVLNEKGNS